MSIHSLIMRFSAVGGPSNLFPSFVLNNPGAYGDNFGHSVAISNNYFIGGALCKRRRLRFRQSLHL